MSEIAGLQLSVDSSKATLLRPPQLSIPLPASPSGFNQAGSTYNRQSIQQVDNFGNSAAWTRNMANRVVYRVIDQAVGDNAAHTVRLPNNVGSGLMSFSRIDGLTAASGFLMVLNDRLATTTKLVLSPGSSISLAPNLHRITVQASGAASGDYAAIMYPMEIYISNVVFDTLPTTGDLLGFGDYVKFQFLDVGESVTNSSYLPVEIPAGGAIATLCANLVAAFNTAYVAAIEPANSQNELHWAKVITADDAVNYYNASTDAWLIATNKGVQFASIDPSLIRNTSASAGAPFVQVTTQL